jgi:hypothetical protein
LSKIKCFSCHKNGNYASQCSEKKNKGNEKMCMPTSTKMQLDEFASKFEKDYSMVSFLYTRTTPRSAWFLDNGAYRHMTEAREIFSSLMKKDSKVHVELGDDAENVVKVEGTIMFQRELGGSLDAHDVLYILCLKKSFL